MGLERINELRRAKGLTIEDLSATSGIPLSTIKKISAGITRNPNLDTVKALAKALECKLDEFNDNMVKVQLPTLLPDPYPRTTAVIRQYEEHYSKYVRLDDYGMQAVNALTDIELARIEYEDEIPQSGEPCEIINLPFSEQPASAGIGVSLDFDSFLQIDVISNDLTDKAIFAVPVRGDSMIPEFNNGDIILVSKDTPSIGDYGIFTLNGEGYVKELGEGFLVSLNEIYPDVEMNESIRCNGSVIGKLEPEWIIHQ